MGLRAVLHREIEKQSRWVADWLHSKSAFIVLVYGTIAWIPFVVTNLDPHGFLYLYIATSLSLVTQVPLAMLAFWAAEEAHRNEQLTRQMLENQLDMMKLLLSKFGDLEDEIIEEMRDHHGEDHTD